MNDQSTIDKIKKLEGKKKSAGIIKLMESKHTDNAIICAGLESLAHIADEDSVNHITHYLDHSDPSVRLAACRAGIAIGTEYMKTRVHYQFVSEQDPQTKEAIKQAYNEKFE